MMEMLRPHNGIIILKIATDLDTENVVSLQPRLEALVDQHAENIILDFTKSNIRIINQGINIICRNNMHRFFQLKMGECLVFQKLSQQEQVILKALDYLNK